MKENVQTVVESLRINRTKSKQVVSCKVVKSYTEARLTSDPPRPQDRPDTSAKDSSAKTEKTKSMLILVTLTCRQTASCSL